MALIKKYNSETIDPIAPPQGKMRGHYSRLVNPLGHLSPNGSLAKLAALYPFNGLPDSHRHFKLAIILGLSQCGQSAFVP
jgi:hypothetical protein